MSKNTDEIVFKTLPQEKRMDYGYVDCQLALKKAITEGKLVVPLSREKIKQILNDNDMENNVHKAEALFQAQFGGNK